MIDNRESPGIADDQFPTMGLELPVGAGRGMFEAPTVTCSHCQTVLVLNPLRTRDRSWCQKCDHYICDGCGMQLVRSGVCRPFSQIIEEIQKAAATNVPQFVLTS